MMMMMIMMMMMKTYISKMDAGDCVLDLEFSFTWGRLSLLTEMCTRDISLGQGSYLGLTTLPPSCANCLEILGASTSRSPECLK